eukprot:jgi/Mesvir1/7495/Mv19256-RA.1
MQACPSQDMNLERLLVVPGVGAQVMALLPIRDWVRMRRTSHALLAAADESLSGLTELFGEDVAGGGNNPGTAGLAWLIRKCPNLQVLSVASRADHEAPWQDRDRWALSWPSAKFDRIGKGLLSLNDIARRLQGLRCLNLAGCMDVTGAALVDVARSCRDLERLDVSGCHVADASIELVVEYCPRLRRLAVSDCTEVTDASLVAVGQHCRLLEVLLADFTSVTDAGVTAVARRCPRLRALAVALRIPQNYRIPPAARNVTDEGISQLAEHCPHLEHLGIGYRNYVTDASVKRIVENCPGITRLDAPQGRLCDAGNITDVSLFALAERCPGLTRLDVSGACVTDAAIIAIAGHCERLEHLDVSFCRSITNASVKAIAEHCPRLRYISVLEATEIRDWSLQLVAENCPDLRVFNGASGGDILWGSLKALAANCPELRSLEAYPFLWSEGGMSMAEFARACPKLESIRFSSAKLDDEMVLDIACTAKNLKVFCASCGIISAGVIRKLVEERGPQLRVLRIPYADLTDDIIKLIAYRCPRLQELKLSHCRVNKKRLRILMSGCPELRRLDVRYTGLMHASILECVDASRCHVIHQYQRESEYY